MEVRPALEPWNIPDGEYAKNPIMGAALWA
jgi:hypothetical protein